MATFDKAINFLSCSLSCLSAYFLSEIQDLFEYVHFQNQVDTSNQCLDIEWFEESYWNETFSLPHYTLSYVVKTQSKWVT